MSGHSLNRRQILAAMTAAGLSPAFYQKAALSADGKTLKVRSYADIQNLDPAFRKGAPEDDVMRNIFVGLADMTPGDVCKCKLDAASKLEQVDPTHIEFTLMDGLTWTDGHGALTADDVK